MIEFCTMCGNETQLSEVRENTANNHACGDCGATLRYRGQAAEILAHFSNGRFNYIKDAVKRGGFDGLSIYEVAIKGPLQRIFSSLEGYQNSYYWEDVALGDQKNGVRCEDITQLTFEDGSFNLAISTEVMEHVHDPWQGFREMWRVLKPGGCYIFTIPVRAPFREKSVTRASIDEKGQLVHHLEPNYHKSGINDKSLVFTDFGADLFFHLEEIGFHLSYSRATACTKKDNVFGTFCATKVT